MIDRLLDRLIEDDRHVFRLLRWLLYGRKLRETIVHLKAKGDFRAEGLKTPTLYWCLAHLVCFTGSTLVLFFSWGHWNQPYLLFLGGCLVAFEVLLLSQSGKGFELIATGIITEGIIVAAEYWWPNGGWHLHYQFHDPQGAVCKGFTRLNNKKILNERPRTGDSIIVIFDPNHPRTNSPFVPEPFPKTCISWSRLRQLANKPFIRR